jgi:hypothetical protein
MTVENLKNDILRYPSSEEGLKFLCKNIGEIKSWNGVYNENFCSSSKINDYVYKNINSVIIFYYKGENKIDEYGFGDDMRENTRIFEQREAKKLKQILFNSIYISFFFGAIVTFLFLNRRKKEF